MQEVFQSQADFWGRHKAYVYCPKKFCIRETLTLMTNVDRSTDTIFFCFWRAVEVPLKCRQSANSQQPTATATATDLPLVTLPLSTVGWSKTSCFNNVRNKGPPFVIHIDEHCNSMAEPAQRAESVKIWLISKEINWFQLVYGGLSLRSPHPLSRRSCLSLRGPDCLSVFPANL